MATPYSHLMPLATHRALSAELLALEQRLHDILIPIPPYPRTNKLTKGMWDMYTRIHSLRWALQDQVKAEHSLATAGDLYQS
jgi:hypothetical protein